MILTPSAFAQVCYAVRGPDWRTWMAQRLRKSERTIRRYADGDAKRGIPRTVADELLCIVREQIQVLQAYETELME